MFIDTLIDLKLTYGVNDEWNMIIGTYNIKTFECWSGYRDILNNTRIIEVDGIDGDALDCDAYNFVSCK